MIKIDEKISLKEQVALLKKCKDKGSDLNEELRKLGLTYDHLRYRIYTEGKVLFSEHKSIEDYKQKNHGIPCVSFFSGAGGLDIGFEYAGFDNLASVEVNELFCETLRLNYPSHLVIGPPDFSGDVKDKEEIAKVLKRSLGIKAPFEGVFHGGPPCQPFSIASNQRFAKEDDNFKRKGFSDKEKGNLLYDYIWFIKLFRPKVFLIENVPGLIEIDNGKELNKSLAELVKLGYKIARPHVLNAADFGVPQRRLRLIIIGARQGPNFEYPSTNLSPTPCFAIFERPILENENHVTREHNAESILRYMELSYGQRDQLGRVDRLNPFLPSKTVIAGGTKGGGRSHLHPYSPRTLSVRESARLQTFPDNYVFVGPSARQFTQVGNAVPPLLASKIAREIYTQYFF